MNPTLFVYTDFSSVAENALKYACRLAEKSGYDLLLFHNFALPVSYMAEALALYTFNENFNKAEENLATELEWVLANYPGLNIKTEIAQGSFSNMVSDLSANYNARCLLIGSPENQADYFTFDGDFIETLLGLKLPVLVIPSHINFSKINNVGLACDYRNRYTPETLQEIRDMEALTGAALHVIHINNRKNAVVEAHKNELEQALQDFNPQYINIEGQDFANAVIHYAKEHEIDLLVVIPQKHGFLDSFFRQRSIRRLAKVNQLPILALPDLA